jgi:hypothetical protein
VITVPSQPTNLDASEIGENSVKLQWGKPVIAGDNLAGYDLYWNDTYTKVCLLLIIIKDKNALFTN